MSTQTNQTPADYSTDSSSAPSDLDEALKARVEALLFVSAQPVGVSQLAAALNVSPRQVEPAINSLVEDYETRGLRIQQHRGNFQLTTAPEFGVDVQNFLRLENISRLTRPALETLAIIAYQQPVTRPQIDSIRGVNSDSVLRTLLRHGLVEEVDRSHGPGRPILYATTPDFLQYFGLNSLEELPPLQNEVLEER